VLIPWPASGLAVAGVGGLGKKVPGQLPADEDSGCSSVLRGELPDALRSLQRTGRPYCHTCSSRNPGARGTKGESGNYKTRWGGVQACSQRVSSYKGLSLCIA